VSSIFCIYSGTKLTITPEMEARGHSQCPLFSPLLPVHTLDLEGLLRVEGGRSRPPRKGFGGRAVGGPGRRLGQKATLSEAKACTVRVALLLLYTRDQAPISERPTTIPPPAATS
jgi:hypothetical protein